MSEAAEYGHTTEIAEFLSAALPHHPFSARRLRQGVFEHPGFAPELTRIRRDSDGKLEAFLSAVMASPSENGKRAQLLLMAVRADRRRQGAARELYAEIEQELRRREVKEILVADSSLCLGLDLRYQAAATMLLRRVFVPTDVAYDMTLDPDRPIPEPPNVEGFSFRDLNEADAEVLAALCAAEFPGMTGALKFLRGGEPCGVVGAFSVEGNLAAFAGWNEYVFNFTGTAKAYRRLGLGEAVFWRAVRRMRETGFPDILISRAHLSYYARAFGCRLRGVLWFMRKNLVEGAPISRGK